MRVRTEIEYALRCLILLAHSQRNAERAEGPGARAKPISVGTMAKRERLSRDYVEQIFLRMRRGGLVKSVRGVQGGYLLKLSPEDIDVSDVYEALYGSVLENPCNQMKSECKHTPARCRMYSMWNDLEHHLSMQMSRWTLQRLAEGEGE